MDTSSHIDCQGPPNPEGPGLRDVHVLPDIELKNHVFLRSLMPCCAQSALPYWAKVVGKLRNNKTEEVFIRATITLYGHDDAILAQYFDTLALESGEDSEFEVRLLEFHDRAEKYGIAIEATGPF